MATYIATERAFVLADRVAPANSPDGSSIQLSVPSDGLECSAKVRLPRSWLAILTQKVGNWALLDSHVGRAIASCKNGPTFLRPNGYEAAVAPHHLALRSRKSGHYGLSARVCDMNLHHHAFIAPAIVERPETNPHGPL